MGQCVLCSKKGLFLSVTKFGLCKACHSHVDNEVVGRIGAVCQSLASAEDEAKVTKKVEVLEGAIAHGETLLALDGHGLPLEAFWTPREPELPAYFFRPAELVAHLREYRDQAVIAEAAKIAKWGTDKAKVATAKSASNWIKKAILKIENLPPLLDEPTKMETLLAELEKMAYEIPLQELLEKAEKEEFKGNNKKAVDQYLEALFYLKKDEVPGEEQAKKIGELEQKIEALRAPSIQ